MLNLLARLRQKCEIGYISGSDLAKQQEQLRTSEVAVTTLFDFCFAENGLTVYKNGAAPPSNSFIRWIGEDQYKEFVRVVLHYIADLDILIKRGAFVEFRKAWSTSALSGVLASRNGKTSRPMTRSAACARPLSRG